MINPASFIRHYFLITVVTIVCVGWLFISHYVEAAIARPGALITQAKANYIGPDSSNSVTVFSKLATVQVLAVEAMTLTVAKQVPVSPAALVRVAFQLTNTGNVLTSFRFVAESLPGDFALSDIKLHQEGARGGELLDSKQTISLEPDTQPVTLWLTAKLPPHLTHGRAQVRLRVMTEDGVEEVAESTLELVAGANVEVDGQLARAELNPGDRVSMTLRAGNQSLTVEAREVASAHGTPIRIDGAAESVFLLRHELPLHTRYIDQSSTLSTAEPSARVLFRLRGDAKLNYRSTLNASEAERVVELAVALPKGLAPGRQRVPLLEYQLQIADEAPRGMFSSTVEAFFGDGAPDKPRFVRSNPIVLIIGGARSVPDLQPKVQRADEFSIDQEHDYTLHVVNSGGQPTKGPLLLNARLDQRISVLGVQGHGWRCKVTQQTIACTSDQVLLASATSHEVQVKVRVASSAVPQGPGIDLNSCFDVAGGGEPALLAGNNSICDKVRISQGSNLTGRVWLDADHNGRFDNAEEPLAGWRAQLLYSDSGKVEKEVETGSDGTYRLTGLKASRVYSLRILSPRGTWHGLPQDDGGAKAKAHHANGWLEYPKIQPGVDLREQNLAVSPTGRVYNAVTREPVAGAKVALRAVGRNARPSDYLGAGSDTDVLTDHNGHYFFDFLPQAGGVFKLEVQSPTGYQPGFSKMLPPQDKHLVLPAGSGVHKVSSDLQSESPLYYSALARAPGSKRLVNNNLALDPDEATGRGLVLRMEVDRAEVEAVDFVNYRLFLKHNLTGSLAGLRITDTLPPGFSYVAGSARVAMGGGAARAAAAPSIQGSQLQFDLSDLSIPNGAETILTYKTRVGAIVKEGTRAINRASAIAGALSSNEASAVVRVVGGVFSDEAFAVGKVFLDCDQDGRQGEGEKGVPGVRIYMEDGTFVETDKDGKYSLYGLKPLTHVFKLDPTTLPSGAVPLVLSNRNAGNGNSRFVDLRNGELGRADFALRCGPTVQQEVEARYQRYAAMPSELENAVKIRLDQTVAMLGHGLDVKNRPASGVINASGQPVTATEAAAGSTEQGSKDLSANAVQAAAPRQAKQKQAKPQPMDELLQNADNSLAFLDFKDGEVLLGRQTNIRVKGHNDTALRLEVNDKVLGLDRVGQRSEAAEQQMAGWEYIGVNLLPGKNRLTLRQAGTEQSTSITLIAPGDLDRIDVSVPENAKADGKTPVAIQVRLLDRDGVLVGSRHSLTLESSAGLWQTEDLDPMTAGAQVMLEGGAATYYLQPPAEAGEVLIRVSSGAFKTEQRTAFVPELRDMIAVGVLEGVVNLRNGAIKPAGARDGFERELRNFSRSWNDGKGGAGGRAAFFLKGKVKGEYLLTAAYDSEKTAKDRMFRDIQPDRYYPVYGDSSLRGFDAQSTSRLYLRVDKERSYLVYGDFTTSANQTLRQLTQYNRSVTGVQHHLEKGIVSADLFASHDNLTQQVVEIQPDGGRGPFRVFGGDFVEGSERVEVITYDRNQPGLVVETKTLSRSADYEIESYSGNLRFRDPQSSLDKDTLNPRKIRVTFEVDGTGANFWVLGADVQVQVTDKLKLGGIAIEDRNPTAPRQLRGATLQADLAKGTRVNAELAMTRSPEAELGISTNNSRGGKGGDGKGARVELNHESGDLKTQVSAMRTDDAFDNISAPIGAGQTEVRARGDYRLDQKHTLKGELMDSKSNQKELNTDRTGGTLSVERVISETLRAEVGSRIAHGTAQSAAGNQEIDLKTLRGKLTSTIPSLPGAAVYGEYEQDVRDSEKRMLALGADYQMKSGGRVYGRHEAISSLGSLYDLGNQKGNYRSLFGAEHQYMQDGHAFSEYRDGGAINERGAEAAYGLRNGWQLDQGLRASTSFERTKALGGKAGEESTVVTGTLEYLPNSRWKGSTSLELRRATSEDSILNTFNLGYKIDPDWTLLGKSVIYHVRGRGTNENGDSLRTRQRIGAAYRQTDSNGFDALGYYEHRLETGTLATADSTRRHVHILSTHANIQPWTDTVFSARYAYKHVDERGGGPDSTTSAHLIAGRVTRDLDERWDIGLNASTLLDGTGGSSRRDRTALGIEVGHVLKDDLWLSLGYNFIGFLDRDFSETTETAQGVYFRMRYKFDETSF